MKTNNKISIQTKMMRLGIIGMLAIMGLVMMLNTSQQIQGQVSFTQIERTPTQILNTDFNPCKNVNCGIGTKAEYVGEDRTVWTRTHTASGNTLCQCPNGKITITRPSTPRRY